MILHHHNRNSRFEDCSLHHVSHLTVTLTAHCHSHRSLHDHCPTPTSFFKIRLRTNSTTLLNCKSWSGAIMSWPARPVEPNVADHYFDLGLDRTATTRDVKLAYMRLAKVHHPDKRGTAEQVDAFQFRKVNEAYEILKDPVARAAYDYAYPQVFQLWCKYNTELADWQAENKVNEQRKAQEKKSKLRAQERQEREEQEQQKYNEEQTRKAQEAKWRREEKMRESRLRQKQAEEHRAREEEQRMREEQEARRVKEQEQKFQQERAKAEMERKERERQEATREKWQVAQERERQQRLRAQEQQAAAAAERLRQHHEKEAADAEAKCQNSYSTQKAQKDKQRAVDEERLKQEQASKLRREERQREADERSRRVMQEAQARQREVAEQKLRLQAPDPTTPKKRPYPDTPDSTPNRPTKTPKVKTDNLALRNSMARIHAREKHMQALLDLGGMGHEAELMGVYIELGWDRMAAKGKCDFCKRNIQLEMYVCPSGESKACTPCKMKFCYYSSC
ncbi:hypothetical protein HBH56_063400 [Parastagonospora nodorum]|nr:hypothetical protein HBH56_063400 [Parastagonospora nodorum]KAH3930666.1 hypothetical protein HBH54_107340 [Parastagonospora nodorum]KAH3954505.1 hypothetical protein HBH53_022280 [Parastagonospora nodorum]KAH4010051.1 hypothetical protein HBI13_213380 [Parastagonospora nodorum]KAH4017735.1 hypothetical protein HBI09_193730 [Parastagonospora nodorum]